VARIDLVERAPLLRGQPERRRRLLRAPQGGGPDPEIAPVEAELVRALGELPSEALARLAQPRVSAHPILDVVEALAVPHEPDRARRDVQVHREIDEPRGEVTL